MVDKRLMKERKIIHELVKDIVYNIERSPDTTTENQLQSRKRKWMEIYKLIEELGINEFILGDDGPERDSPTPNRNEGRGPRQ